VVVDVVVDGDGIGDVVRGLGGEPRMGLVR
jgi:hypothetical protein